VFASADFLGCQVDLEVFDFDVGVFSAVASAQKGSDASEEFFECKWFDEIVVGAEVEAFDAVFDCVLGG